MQQDVVKTEVKHARDECCTMLYGSAFSHNSVMESGKLSFYSYKISLKQACCKYATYRFQILLMHSFLSYMAGSIILVFLKVSKN